jgi:predicted dehydrogenase
VEALRIALVGAGGGSDAHLRAAQLTGAVAVRGIVDRDHNRAGAQAQRFDLAREYPTFPAALDDPDVDCVVLVVPPDAHEPLALEALAAGKHVVCEKPLARTRTECDRMIAAAADHGRHLLPVHNRIYSHAIERIAALLSDGELGTIHLALSVGIESPETVARAPWLRDDSSLGGVLLAQAIHPIYVLRALLGDVTAVTAQLGDGVLDMAREDTAVVALRFACGAVASLSATFASADGPGDHAITLLGALGSVHTTLRGGTPRQPEQLTAILPDRYGDDQPRLVALPDSDGWATSFQRMWEDYAGAIRGDGPARVTAQDGRAAVAVVRDAYAAAGVSAAG